MKVLVANNFLFEKGGSETFCYALIQELKRMGHDVEYFTFFKGEVSEKIEIDLEVSYMSKSKYDLILANHYTCVRYLAHRGKIIQTCHGIFPSLEQPSKYADGYVSISEEVANHLLKQGIKSRIIHNGINCDRYCIKTPLSIQLNKVLSLCQSDTANAALKDACELLEVNFKQLNKYKNPIWDVEDAINEADLVVGLGRSAYEAMACGRNVLVFDKRKYSESYSDGYLNQGNINNSIINNCSGRFYKKKLNVKELVIELQKYNPQDGFFLRNYALDNLNIKIQVEKYFEYSETLSNARSVNLYFIMCFQYLKYIKKIFKKKINIFFSITRA